jgi:tetratricopeptide (TPR) repeat protein
MPLRGAALWLLLALTLLAYANSFAGAFLFDDPAVLFADPRLRSFGAFAAGVGETIRPFAKLTFLVDRWLYGERPAGYHALNLLLHLASGGLVYRILLHPSIKVRDPLVAISTTLLFLLHPIATEAVTYISGRPTGLMTCGYLAAFLLFLEARGTEPGASRQKAMLAWAAVCLALALLAKEVAVVFPALLLLYEAVLGRPPRADRAGLLRRVHLPLAAVVVVFLLYAALHGRYAYLFDYGLRLRSVYDNLLTQAHVVVYALTLFVRPTQLNFEHDLPLATSILQGPTPWSIATIAGLVAVAIALVRRAPLVAFGILWFFLHLLPTNSVLPRYDLLSERNLYLPSIGLYLAAAASTVAIGRSLGARMDVGVVAASAGAALALGLAALTFSRNAVYADPVVFWSDAVAKSPHKARPHANLGIALYVAGDLERAIEQFRIALALDPLDQRSQQNLLDTWKRLTRTAAPPQR